MIDISSNIWRDEIEITNQVLKEIGAKGVSKILVFNKIDRLSEDELCILKDDIRKNYDEDALFISVIETINIDELLNIIEKKVRDSHINVSVNVPYSDYSILSMIHNNYVILEEKHLDNGTFINFNVPESEFKKFEKYIIDDLEK